MVVALQAAGVDVATLDLSHGPFVPETGYEAVHRLMAAALPPTAIICGNDSIAIGALNAARARGLDVPADVSVVGFDDLPIAAWELVQLTTVRQPMDDMARSAARMLVDRIEGRAGRGGIRRTVFQPELILRRTLAGPPRR